MPTYIAVVMYFTAEGDYSVVGLPRGRGPSGQGSWSKGMLSNAQVMLSEHDLGAHRVLRQRLVSAQTCSLYSLKMKVGFRLFHSRLHACHKCLHCWNYAGIAKLAEKFRGKQFDAEKRVDVVPDLLGNFYLICTSRSDIFYQM